MNTRMVRVGRQELWVAVKPGSKDRPPLLLFNGIGANLELAGPFMRAMTNVEVVIFDIPGVGGSPLPAPYDVALQAPPETKWGCRSSCRHPHP